MGYKSEVKFLMKEKDFDKLIKFSKTSEAPEALERLLTIGCVIARIKLQTDLSLMDG